MNWICSISTAVVTKPLLEHPATPRATSYNLQPCREKGGSKLQAILQEEKKTELEDGSEISGNHYKESSPVPSEQGSQTGEPGEADITN